MGTSDQLGIGVVGFGYWGPNLVRNFTAHSATHVVAVADVDPARRAAVATHYPWVETVETAEALFADPRIDAIALVTPLLSHFPLAQAALQADKHVLVEKPLAHSVSACEQLKALASARNRVLMVDHTFVYTPAVRMIRSIIEAGQLGRVLYFDSVRINLGLFQPDFNVIWDLAPHDLSIIDYVLGGTPRWVSAIGASHYGAQENLAYVTIGFDDQLLAHVHCNWVAPVKTRRITIAGTEKMLVYDDTQPDERIKVYSSGVDVEHLDREATYNMNVQYRTGDVLVPKLDSHEALKLVVDEFSRAIRGHSTPTTDVDAGIRVVRMLEAAQQSITGQGVRVSL